MNRYPHRRPDAAPKEDELVFIRPQRGEEKTGFREFFALIRKLCLNLLAADEQHESHVEWSHRRRGTLGLSCEVVRLAQHD